MSKGFSLLAIVAIAFVLSSPARAQEHGPPPGASDRNVGDGVSDIKSRSVEMERARRDAEKADKKSENSPNQNFPQIKEDFERIQIINSDVLQAASTHDAAPDYMRISEAASELKKRAVRLKSNLFAAESEKHSKDKSKEATEQQQQQDVKSLLVALDSAIGGFVSSPIFQNIKVIDPQDSAKARQSLEQVIKLSTQVSKEADKMKKATEGSGKQ